MVIIIQPVSVSGQFWNLIILKALELRSLITFDFNRVAEEFLLPIYLDLKMMGFEIFLDFSHFLLIIH